MKPHTWNPDKNEWLKQKRGFGFEAVIEAVESGGLLDDVPNPNDSYGHQRLYIVELDGYAVVVPYVEDEEYIFLKTAFHDRKVNKKYLNR